MTTAGNGFRRRDMAAGCCPFYVVRFLGTDNIESKYAGHARRKRSNPETMIL